MKTSSIYFGHTYDGMVYANLQNSTYEGYEPPSWCPYTGPFYLDIRCRFYYMPTMMSVSTQIFSPQLQYGGTAGSTYLATAYCQRRLRYQEADPNAHNDNYSILCMALDLSLIPQYFQNFGSNSKFQMFLDPQELTVVYDSLKPLQQSVIATVEDFETNYLEDQSQAKKFLQYIKQNYEFILSNTSSVFMSDKFDISQPTFEYNRNGTECFVIMNTVKMNDKVPKYEYLRKIDPASKYQVKSVYLFLDVLSKQQMQQYSATLQDTIKQYNLIFTYSSLGIILFLLAIQFYYSVLLGKQILSPLIHLTHILKQIRIQNKSKEGQTENEVNIVDPSRQKNSIIFIDEQLDADIDGVCFSSDTQILLESFQNMFKILRFTTQNFYKENESISLLNLNIQIEHFQQFGNHRAMGVCHNNMGVIHFNQARYQEAVEHFLKAIIYAKYELNTYSHDNDGQSFWNQVKRFSIGLRNSFQSHSTVSANFESTSALQNNSANSERQPVSSEKQNLYWNLYNRNENYLKALSLYIRKGQQNLWETFLEIAFQNTSLSQMFLPHSFKREVMNFYAILFGYDQLNLLENKSQIISIINNLYQQTAYQKQQLAEGSQSTNSKVLYPHSPQFLPNHSLLNSQSASLGIPTKQLLSPLKKLKHEQQQQQQQYQQSNDKTSYYKKDYQYQQQQYQQIEQSSNYKMLNPNQRQQNNVSKTNLFKSNDGLLPSNQPVNLRDNQTKQQFWSKPQYEGIRQQYSIAEEESYINLKKQKSENGSNNLEKQNDMIVQNQVEYNSQQQPKLQNKQSFNFSQNSNTVQNKSNSELNKLKISMKNVSLPYSNLKQNRKYDKIIETQALALQSVQSGVQNRNSSNTSTSNKKLDYTSQLQAIFAQSYGSTNQNIIPNTIQYRIHYPVRKIKSEAKVSVYEFSSDIVFIFYVLQQAKYLIELKKFYEAAVLLSNTMEKTKYYLPHHKLQIIELLVSIFKMNQIESIHLKELHHKYRKYINHNFQVCLISACKKNKNKEKVRALSSDFVKEVLFKEKDVFGLLSYSFEEHLYLQLMSFTYVQTIKSNPQFFEFILNQLPHRLHQNAEQQNEGEQTKHNLFTQKSTYNERSTFNDTNYKNRQDEERNQENLLKNIGRMSSLSNTVRQGAISEYFKKNKHTLTQDQQSILEQTLKEENVDQNRLGTSSSSCATAFQPQNTEISSNMLLTQNYYQIDMERNKSKQSPYQYSKIDLLNNSNDQSNAFHKMAPYLNYSQTQHKRFLLQSVHHSQQSFSFNDLPSLSQPKKQNYSSLEQSQQQQQQFPSFTEKNDKINESSCAIPQTNYSMAQDNKIEIINSHISSPPSSTFIEKSNNLPASSNLSQGFFSNQRQQERYNQQQQVQKDIKQQKRVPALAEKMTSELVFHQGVNAAIKQFILNTEQKVTNYLTKRKLFFSDKSVHSKALQKSQLYLVYATDQPLEFKQKHLLNYLCEFLVILDIELLVLEINEIQVQEEFSPLQNIVLYGKSVITFFHSESKLLQYIYNNREHVKNNVIPMIFEHF